MGGDDATGQQGVDLVGGVVRLAQDVAGVLAQRRHREAVCPRVAYMPQGLGRNLYPTLSVFPPRLIAAAEHRI